LESSNFSILSLHIEDISTLFEVLEASGMVSEDGVFFSSIGGRDVTDSLSFNSTSAVVDDFDGKTVDLFRLSLMLLEKMDFFGDVSIFSFLFFSKQLS
jgi:hypothetical protein